jgi:hypothetical protein
MPYLAFITYHGILFDHCELPYGAVLADLRTAIDEHIAHRLKKFPFFHL